MIIYLVKNCCFLCNSMSGIVFLQALLFNGRSDKLLRDVWTMTMTGRAIAEPVLSVNRQYFKICTQTGSFFKQKKCKCTFLRDQEEFFKTKKRDGKQIKKASNIYLQNFLKVPIISPNDYIIKTEQEACVVQRGSFLFKQETSRSSLVPTVIETNFFRCYRHWNQSQLCQ